MINIYSLQIGFIHSISQLGAGVASYVSGFSSDFLLKKDWLSTTHCRKIFSFLGKFMFLQRNAKNNSHVYIW